MKFRPTDICLFLRRFRLGTATMILVLAIAALLFFRFMPGGGEFYATRIYPQLSAKLSYLSSLVGFSLDEIVAAVFLFKILFTPLWGRWNGYSVGEVFRREAMFIGWLFVWFYAGWGTNYYRDSFYQRTSTEPLQYDSLAFRSFLDDYTRRLNASYCPVQDIDHDSAVDHIHDLFRNVPPEARLAAPHSFQRPKRLLFNRLYSSVGVLGFMGPFMCESHVNEQLFPSQYPFTYAHELSHLLGVSSEDEANFWAFYVCSHSTRRAVRYSGYYGLLPYVAGNAAVALSVRDFERWLETVRPEIRRQWQSEREFWQAQRSPLLDKAQTTLYNWFLKSNNVSSGIASYNQVVRMIISYRKSLSLHHE